MEDNVYIPRDVRFSENILWSLDLWGTIWFAVIALISLSILRYLWAWFGVYGFGVIAFIDAFTYMYHSEYPGRNPLRTRDVLRPIFTFFINQRLNYQLVNVVAKMSDNEYMSLSVEKIKPIFTPEDAETEFILCFCVFWREYGLNFFYRQ